jgi:hypothetical protein
METRRVVDEVERGGAYGAFELLGDGDSRVIDDRPPGHDR